MSELDFTDFDPEHMDDRVVPGKYHILIQDVDDGDEKSLVIKYEILAGDPSGQEGKTGTEYLAKLAKSADKQKFVTKRLVRFALAAGIVTMDDLIAIKKTGKGRIDFAAAINRQICVECVKSGEKGYVNWTFEGIYGVDSNEAKDIPKNAGLLGSMSEAVGDPLAGASF